MVNYTKTMLHSLISLIFGIILALPTLYLTTDRRALFWFLILLIWGTIGSLNGYLLKDYFESLIYNLFLASFLFIFLFLMLLIFNSFGTLLLEFLNFSETSGINKGGIFLQSFLIALIIIAILLAILIGFTFLGLLINRIVKNSKQNQSSLSQEADFYKMFESPTNTGRYRQKEDDDFE